MTRWYSKLGCIITVSMVALVVGCSHSIHQLYIGMMDADAKYGKGRWITVETKDFVILGFARDTSYVEKAVAQLEKQCSGRIAQVTTEHVTSFSFLSYYQKVILKGLCTGA